jgi:hypothetical protein
LEVRFIDPLSSECFIPVLFNCVLVCVSVKA